ncbi:hypothetical protein MMC31_004029 [Peltigera leucophlebia]|nr:hypothetical protein [Peltigera leucophlebia]
MGHWDRDQDGLENSAYVTDGSDSDIIEEVLGNDSSGGGESESDSDSDEEIMIMKGVRRAI